MAVDREKVAQTALKMADKKRYAPAIAEYQKILHEDPNDARTLLKIGDLQLKMEAYQAAIETYERVGKFYVGKGLVRKAIAVYLQVRDLLSRHAPELDGRYEHVLPKLAELYEQCGLTSDALAALDEAATKLLRAGRDAEAITNFEKVVSLDPGNPLAHLRLAEALGRARHVDTASEHFATASDLLLRLGRRDDALKVLDRLLQLRPDATAAKTAATIYLERAQGSDGMLALAKLQVAFQADPRDLDTLLLLARAFELIGQAPKAVEVQKELARLALDQGRLDVSKTVIAQLRAAAPDDEAVRALVARSEAATREPSATTTVEEVDVDEIESLDEPEDYELEEVEGPFSGDLVSEPPSLAKGGAVVRVPASMRAVEDTHAPEDFDAETYTQQALVDASAFRRQGRRDKAIEALRVASEMVPDSMALREMLRDLLLETGDREGAVGEMITLASLAIDQADGVRATAILREVVRLVPGHHRACELLADLGFEPAPDAYGKARSAETNIEGRVRHDAGASYGSYDPDEPLPSYDLEEVGPGEGFASTAELRAVRSASFVEPDDPFGDASSARGGRRASDPPLPSFSLVDEAEAAGQSGEILGGTRGFQGGDSIEEALEEVDFFAGRGLHDDARAILAEQLARSPAHPLLLERLRELDESLAAAAHPHDESGTRAVVPEPKSMRPLARAFDVDEALESFEPRQEARNHFESANEQVDVEAVFAKFKEGVKEQVADNDSTTHYDLGIAYKEMGLLNDAIDEFMTAARNSPRACVCHSMVGMLEAERGNIDAAIAAYSRALEVTQRSTIEEVTVCYELGALYELQHNQPKALFYFEWAERKEPTFRDVSERVNALRARAYKPAPQRPVIDNDDDFDRVFDDILGGGKLP